MANNFIPRHEVAPNNIARISKASIQAIYELLCIAVDNIPDKDNIFPINEEVGTNVSHLAYSSMMENHRAEWKSLKQPWKFGEIVTKPLYKEALARAVVLFNENQKNCSMKLFSRADRGGRAYISIEYEHFLKSDED